MKAAFLQSPNSILFHDIPIPEPGVGEVRIKLKQIGICGSDVHLFLGHRLLNKPNIIGHEGLGYIDKIGSGVSGREHTHCTVDHLRPLVRFQTDAPVDGL